VMSYERNHLLYDYYNFPEEMYKVKFESNGSPAVASRIVELLNNVSLPHLEDKDLMIERYKDTDVKTRTRS
jgi:aromatic ring-opening dioxygenase catalytic subunit (LigB family)